MFLFVCHLMLEVFAMVMFVKMIVFGCKAIEALSKRIERKLLDKVEGRGRHHYNIDW